MKHRKWKNICFIVFAVVFSSTIFAAESKFDESTLVSQAKKVKRSAKNANKNMNRDPNTWKPYFVCTKAAEPLSSFYQQTVGVGFLYFTGVNGNLNASLAISDAPVKSDTKLQGHLGYNRTPVAEFIIGRDIWYWFKVALSYTHQGGVVVQTQPQNISALTDEGLKPDLTADLSLDAVQAKFYFMCPWTMVWKNYYYEPYLALGVGPGWQTWANITSLTNFANKLRMKVSANCIFSVDLGAKIRKAMPTYVMSFTIGCKYIEWGQARAMGELKDQYASSAPIGGTARFGLTSPLSYRTVFSFAPYVGVQFNY